MTTEKIDTQAINTIRTLSIDAVEQAHSGHPGAPMALAPVAYQLWQQELRYDPAQPQWPDRDRFILSNGHASMLLYSLLHLAGIKRLDEQERVTDVPAVSLEDIKKFRQLDSATPGHPEYHWTTGVETTTGPLGQGVANSVGMAIASRWLAGHFNKPGFELFTHDVYAICGDGDMMEGVASEAASLAGHLQLPNLCWIYDSNHISIDGSTDLAFTEDVGRRFEGYGWRVIQVTDANDLDALSKAYSTFKQQRGKPTLIVVNSHIGYGAPKKQGLASAHGEPLGAEEIKGTKRFYGWPEDAQFLVPDGVKERFQERMGARGKQLREAWEKSLAGYRQQHPELAHELDRMLKRELPDGWDKELPVFPADAKGMATRESGGKVLNALAKNYPWLVGGSADLNPSTKTYLSASTSMKPGEYAGRNIHFGVREHAMGSIVNGLNLSKVRAYGATFLIFSDYERPAMRLSSLMEIPSIHIFTHDSIGLGEDGPTHQPVEQLVSLRAIPGNIVIRPGDANEVTEAWRYIAQQQHHPVVLVLSRQPVPTLDRTKFAPASGLSQGAYILQEAEGGKPDVILIGTGTEVALVIEAAEKLKAEGVKARVVSMPSWELFEQQPAEYQERVLPAALTARVAVEKGAAFGWERWVGHIGSVVGMRSFGASAPIKALQQKFGFTVENVVKEAHATIAKMKKSKA
ncbi:transketolase [Corallococcus praedator]|uniref:Transketolase n=1 Tax=Corallococcus praedator TaxID=2316724 RepID=A0ABX9QBN8_9BACT|nr:MULTISPECIES: transketolase [Corallococcus]RKH29220.1 transketolase [Corallococcus sp. CA031C]RKH98505.1 transketolase [Corallococcus praedator]